MTDPVQLALVFAGNSLDAYPDPDIRDSAYIALPWHTNSHFNAGDQIVGVALDASNPFTPVKTWNDYADFVVKSHKRTGPIFVDVLRDGRHMWFWSNHSHE